jgi:sugar (glycoside-pentoside-hexuronide) transporter
MTTAVILHEETVMDDRKSLRLPFGVKLGYGAAELSNSLTWTLFFVVFLYFLTDVVGLNPAFAGFIMMIGKLWDAVTDPFIGIWSDRTKSRFGRRRPFLLGVAVPFGIITWLLFTDFGFGTGGTKVYFLVVTIAYFTIFTMLDVPYTALAAEMTQDYNERTGLISYRALWCQIASIVAAALPWVFVEWLTVKMGGDERLAWSVMTGIFGFFCIFFILWTWRATRGYELFPEETRIRLRDITQDVLRNKTFLYTFGIYTAANVALTVGATVLVYFMIYYMNLTEAQQSIAFLFLFALTIVWIPAITKISEARGKRWAFIIFIGVWALVQGVGGLFVRPDTLVFFYVLAALASGGVISVTMTGWSMIPDVVEVDEYKTGQRREGLYFAFFSFSRKISVAIAVWLVGQVLNWIQYVPDVYPQIPGAELGIRLLYTEGTAVFLVLAMVLAYLLPMTKQKHDALRAAIAAKREGKTPDESGFKDLL